MIIKVTQKHIDNGVKNNCEACPVALAMKDKGMRDIRVMPNMFECIEFTSKAGLIHLRDMPNKVMEFVAKFDTGKKVKPFEFRL